MENSYYLTLCTYTYLNGHSCPSLLLISDQEINICWATQDLLLIGGEPELVLCDDSIGCGGSLPHDCGAETLHGTGHAWNCRDTEKEWFAESLHY